MGKTGFMAMKLGTCAFVIPWIFVYSNQLFMEGPIFGVLFSFVTAIAGVYMLCCGIQGFLLDRKQNILSRLILIAGSVFFIIPGIQTDLIGAAAFGAAYGLNLLFNRKKPEPAA